MKRNIVIRSSKTGKPDNEIIQEAIDSIKVEPALFIKGKVKLSRKLKLTFLCPKCKKYCEVKEIRTKTRYKMECSNCHANLLDCKSPNGIEPKWPIILGINVRKE